MAFVTFKVQIDASAYEERNDARMISQAIARDIADINAVYHVEVTDEPNLTVRGDDDGS